MSKAKPIKITGAVHIDYGEQGALEIWYALGSEARFKIEQLDRAMDAAGSDFARAAVMARFMSDEDEGMGGVLVWWNFIDSENDNRMFPATLNSLISLPHNTLRHLFLEVSEDMRREAGLLS